MNLLGMPLLPSIICARDSSLEKMKLEEEEDDDAAIDTVVMDDKSIANNASHTSLTHMCQCATLDLCACVFSHFVCTNVHILLKRPKSTIAQKECGSSIRLLRNSLGIITNLQYIFSTMKRKVYPLRRNSHVKSSETVNR